MCRLVFSGFGDMGGIKVVCCGGGGVIHGGEIYTCG